VTGQRTRLSAAQRAAWDRDGYLLVAGALSPVEVTQLLHEVDRLHAEAATPPCDGPPATFNAFNVVERGEALLAVMDHPRLLGLVADLVGVNVQLLMSQVMVRAPTPTPALGWHHDGPKPVPFPHVGAVTPLLNLKVGVFLTDVSEPDTGNLLVLPGSHLTPPAHLSGPLAHSAAETTEVAADTPDAVPVLARPGDAILFHNALWHAVGPSRAQRSRTVLYYTYGPVWLRLGDRAAPSADLAAQSSPLRQQLLGARSRPEDHGGMHPGPEGLPLLAIVDDRSYTEVMEAEFRREASRG